MDNTKVVPLDGEKFLNDRFWIFDKAKPLEPKVCLTIEEAERVLECVNFCWQNTYGDMSKSDRQTAKMLYNRIQEAKESV